MITCSPARRPSRAVSKTSVFEIAGRRPGLGLNTRPNSVSKAISKSASQKCATAATTRTESATSERLNINGERIFWKIDLLRFHSDQGQRGPERPKTDGQNPASTTLPVPINIDLPPPSASKEASPTVCSGCGFHCHSLPPDGFEKCASQNYRRR